MRILLCPTAILLAVSTPVFAQNIYGAADLSFSRFSMTDDGVDEGRSNLARADFYVGAAFANGYYLEGEVRSDTVSGIELPVVQNALRSGQQVTVRFGRPTGNATFEVFGGALAETSGDNTAPGSPKIGSHFFGATGSYQISDTVSAYWVLGRMDTDPSVSASNADAFRKFNHGALGLQLALNEKTNIEIYAAGGRGILDQDSDPGTVAQYQVQVSHQFQNSNLSGYIGASKTSYFQGGENDTAERLNVFAGLTWAFGNKQSARSGPRAKLPDYLDWQAVADGTLE